MPRPKQDHSIRDDTARLDTRIPNRIMRRLNAIAKELGLTKQAALLITLEAGCAEYEGRLFDGKARDEEDRCAV